MHYIDPAISFGGLAAKPVNELNTVALTNCQLLTSRKL